jgi:predicted membrane protein
MMKMKMTGTLLHTQSNTNVIFLSISNFLDILYMNLNDIFLLVYYIYVVVILVCNNRLQKQLENREKQRLLLEKKKSKERGQVGKMKSGGVVNGKAKR